MAGAGAGAMGDAADSQGAAAATPEAAAMPAEAVVVIVEGPRSMEEKSAAGRGFLAAATSGDAARGSPVAGIDRSSCAGSGVWSIRTPTGSERERAA